MKSEINEILTLIIEDNPDKMAAINAILKNKYEVSEAIKGDQAFKMIQSQTLDIIPVDMSLPKMDREEIVQLLKRNTETKIFQ